MNDEVTERACKCHLLHMIRDLHDKLEVTDNYLGEVGVGVWGSHKEDLSTRYGSFVSYEALVSNYFVNTR